MMMHRAVSIQNDTVSSFGRAWLRTPSYDLILIAGVFTCAILLGSIATVSYNLFMLVVYADFWLLAPPHVISTYTRIAFDRTSAKRYWFLLAGLPPLVLIATASLAWVGGAIALNTLYFIWQTWHYTRQSHGIARAYRRTALPGISGHDHLTEFVIFGVPTWGILHRAYQQPVEFFGNPIWCIELPEVLITAMGFVVLCVVLTWFCRLAFFRNQVGHNLFVISHVAITIVGYYLIDDITFGWLFINIWHNAQYLLFVWAYNNRRFRAGIEDAHPIISWMSQSGREYHYAYICVGLGVVFYCLLMAGASLITWQVLPMILIAYQTVTFHHYIVDSVIWRTSAG